MNNKQIVEEYYKSVGETPMLEYDTMEENHILVLMDIIKEKLWIVLSELTYNTLSKSWMMYELHPWCTWDYKIDKDIIERDLIINKIKQWK